MQYKSIYICIKHVYSSHLNQMLFQIIHTSIFVHAEFLSKSCYFFQNTLMFSGIEKGAFLSKSVSFMPINSASILCLATIPNSFYGLTPNQDAYANAPFKKNLQWIYKYRFQLDHLFLVFKILFSPLSSAYSQSISKFYKYNSESLHENIFINYSTEFSLICHMIYF